MNATYESLLIQLSNLEYPVSVWEFRSRFPNIAFGDVIGGEDLATLGYAVVKPTPFPVGDVVSEGTPTLIEGQWTQVWDVRAYNAEELEALLTQARFSASLTAMDSVNAVTEQGVPCVFAAGSITMKLTVGNIVHLADAVQEGDLILGTGGKVTQTTVAEAGVAATTLHAKRQLLLTAYRDQLTAIESATSHLLVPADAVIRLAIEDSVL